MFFDASRYITQIVDLPYKDIEQVDKFLAKRFVRQFRSCQIAEKTALHIEKIELILAAYVVTGVLMRQTCAYCPEHDTNLGCVDMQHGYCADCEKQYDLSQCPQKVIYERIREPYMYSDFVKKES